MSDRTMALTDILDDLAAFEFKANHYYKELDLQGHIDSVLTGKLEGLQEFCRILGWPKLERAIQRITPVRGRAVESLEIVQSFIVPQARHLLPTTDVEAVPSRTDEFWKLIHPRIAAQARPRVTTGQLGDAVEASYKEINEVVKRLVRDDHGRELDGAGLMTTAFSVKKPLIRLTELKTTSDKDVQQGYMQIMAGAMTGIRNPFAHGNLNLDTDTALHLICLASLLMRKIDERT